MKIVAITDGPIDCCGGDCCTCQAKAEVDEDVCDGECGVGVGGVKLRRHLILSKRIKRPESL